MTLLREAVSGTSEPPDRRAKAMARAIWFLLYAE